MSRKLKQCTTNLFSDLPSKWRRSSPASKVIILGLECSFIFGLTMNIISDALKKPENWRDGSIFTAVVHYTVGPLVYLVLPLVCLHAAGAQHNNDRLRALFSNPYDKFMRFSREGKFFSLIVAYTFMALSTIYLAVQISDDVKVQTGDWNSTSITSSIAGYTAILNMSMLLVGAFLAYLSIFSEVSASLATQTAADYGTAGTNGNEESSSFSP